MSDKAWPFTSERMRAALEESVGIHTQAIPGGILPSCFDPSHNPKFGPPAPNPYEGIKDNDPVNHPSHYTKGKIEVADFIADQQLNFDRGNAVKYICRAGDKGDAVLSPKDKAIQDLEKAVWYLNHEIDWIKKYGLPG